MQMFEDDYLTIGTISILNKPTHINRLFIFLFFYSIQKSFSSIYHKCYKIQKCVILEGIEKKKKVRKVGCPGERSEGGTCNNKTLKNNRVQIKILFFGLR